MGKKHSGPQNPPAAAAATTQPIGNEYTLFEYQIKNSVPLLNPFCPARIDQLIRLGKNIPSAKLNDAALLKWAFACHDADAIFAIVCLCENKKELFSQVSIRILIEIHYIMSAPIKTKYLSDAVSTNIQHELKQQFTTQLLRASNYELFQLFRVRENSFSLYDLISDATIMQQLLEFLAHKKISKLKETFLTWLPADALLLTPLALLALKNDLSTQQKELFKTKWMNALTVEKVQSIKKTTACTLLALIHKLYQTNTTPTTLELPENLTPIAALLTQLIGAPSEQLIREIASAEVIQHYISHEVSWQEIFSEELAIHCILATKSTPLFRTLTQLNKIPVAAFLASLTEALITMTGDTQNAQLNPDFYRYQMTQYLNLLNAIAQTNPEIFAQYFTQNQNQLRQALVMAIQVDHVALLQAIAELSICQTIIQPATGKDTTHIENRSLFDLACNEFHATQCAQLLYKKYFYEQRVAYPFSLLNALRHQSDLPAIAQLLKTQANFFISIEDVVSLCTLYAEDQEFNNAEFLDSILHRASVYLQKNFYLSNPDSLLNTHLPEMREALTRIQTKNNSTQLTALLQSIDRNQRMNTLLAGPSVGTPDLFSLILTFHHEEKTENEKPIAARNQAHIDKLEQQLEERIAQTDPNELTTARHDLEANSLQLKIDIISALCFFGYNNLLRHALRRCPNYHFLFMNECNGPSAINLVTIAYQSNYFEIAHTILTHIALLPAEQSAKFYFDFFTGNCSPLYMAHCAGVTYDSDKIIAELEFYADDPSLNLSIATTKALLQAFAFITKIYSRTRKETRQKLAKLKNKILEQFNRDSKETPLELALASGDTSLIFSVVTELQIPLRGQIRVSVIKALYLDPNLELLNFLKLTSEELTTPRTILPESEHPQSLLEFLLSTFELDFALQGDLSNIAKYQSSIAWLIRKLFEHQAPFDLHLFFTFLKLVTHIATSPFAKNHPIKKTDLLPNIISAFLDQPIIPWHILSIPLLQDINFVLDHLIVPKSAQQKSQVIATNIQQALFAAFNTILPNTPSLTVATSIEAMLTVIEHSTQPDILAELKKLYIRACAEKAALPLLKKIAGLLKAHNNFDDIPLLTKEGYSPLIFYYLLYPEDYAFEQRLCDKLKDPNLAEKIQVCDETNLLEMLAAVRFLRNRFKHAHLALLEIEILKIFKKNETNYVGLTFPHSMQDNLVLKLAINPENFRQHLHGHYVRPLFDVAVTYTAVHLMTVLADYICAPCNRIPFDFKGEEAQAEESVLAKVIQPLLHPEITPDAQENSIQFLVCLLTLMQEINYALSEAEKELLNLTLLPHLIQHTPRQAAALLRVYHPHLAHLAILLNAAQLHKQDDLWLLLVNSLKTEQPFALALAKESLTMRLKQSLTLKTERATQRLLNQFPLSKKECNAMVQHFTPTECTTLAALSAVFQQVIDEKLSSELSSGVMQQGNTTSTSKKRKSKKRSQTNVPDIETNTTEQSATVTIKASETKIDTGEQVNAIEPSLSLPAVAEITATSTLAAVPAVNADHSVPTPVTPESNVKIAELTPVTNSTTPLQLASEKQATPLAADSNAIQSPTFPPAAMQSTTIFRASAKPFQPATANAATRRTPPVLSAQAPRSAFFSTPVAIPTLIYPDIILFYPAFLEKTACATQFQLKFLPSAVGNFIRTNSTLYLDSAILQWGY